MKAAVDVLRLIAHRNITLERSQKGVKRVCNGLYKGVEAHQFMGEKHCQWRCCLVNRLQREERDAVPRELNRQIM